MAPKGSITAETWQCIARSHDKVNNVANHAMDLLNFNDEERSRFVNIGKKLENKCREYFRLAIHTLLENIRYNNLKVISSNIMDEIQPYIFDQET